MSPEPPVRWCPLWSTHVATGLRPNELPQNCTLPNTHVILRFLGVRRPRELSWVVRARGLSGGHSQAAGSAGHVPATGAPAPRMTWCRPPQGQQFRGAGRKPFRTHSPSDTVVPSHSARSEWVRVQPALTGRGMRLCFFREEHRRIGGRVFKPSGLPLSPVRGLTAREQPTRASHPRLGDLGWPGSSALSQR